MAFPQPMLARLAREIPLGDFLYEPKWDGFRCLAVIERGSVELRSRHQRSFSRYFPEIVEPLASFPDATFDGELLAADFGQLLNRIHPAQSRVERLSHETPATYVLFDVLHWRGMDLIGRPFADRRALLGTLDVLPPLAVTPVTADPAVARRWLEQRDNIDGVVAKSRAAPYEPGRRGWIKIKAEHTVDCVVGGFRPTLDGDGVASLLLGLYQDSALVHVGVSSSFPEKRRRELLRQLVPAVVSLRIHPWERGFNLGRHPAGRLPGSAGRWSASEMAQDWIPLAPVLVCEVAYDKLDGMRFRHPARFLRWRPERDARSCKLEQLRAEEPGQGALPERGVHQG